jgi:glycosyltransferase involved in cell wall biosynthesis
LKGDVVVSEVLKKIGIFTADLMTLGGGSRAGCLMAERLSLYHEVWLISRDRPDVRYLSRSFGVSLAKVRFHYLDAPDRHRFSLGSILKPFATRRVRKLSEQFAAYQRLRALKLDLFIHNTSFHYMKSPAPRGIFMCMFPWPMPQFPQARWCRLPLVKPFIEYVLSNTLDRFPYVPENYDRITANSQFTAGWTRKLWRKDAPVIYSATDLMSPSYRKDKIILSVGRYNSDKQQHVLVDVFREMTELHRHGWELHLAGKINPGESGRRYHAQLVETAKGYPVNFHYDLTLEDLRRLYQRSAIYWHAKGYGIPDDEPHRMEHFGNTPLEAMSAGCVPVVVKAGGLCESVRHGVNGFLWKNLDEMREQTLRLAQDPAVLAQFRERAAKIDPRYGIEPFLTAVETLVDEVLALDK